METVADTNTVLDSISAICSEMIEDINSSSEANESHLNDYKYVQKRLQMIPANLDVLNKFNTKTTVNNVKEICEKNNMYLKRLETSRDEFHHKLEKLEQCNIEAEEKVKSLEQKLLGLKAKQMKMEKKRDKILVFKLLTNTHFCYETKSVKGYILGQTPGNVRSFDLNPNKLSTKDITEALYAAVKKVCDGSAEKNNVEKEIEDKK